MAYSALRKAVEAYGRRIDEVENQATIWKIAFFFTLLMLVISSGVNIYLALKSDIRPFVVRLKDAEIIKVNPLEELPAPNTYEVKAELKDFIESARTIIADAEYQKKLLEKVYIHIQPGSPAYNTMNQYYAVNNPYDRARSLRVSVSDTTVVAVSPKTYLVEWTEQYKQPEGAVYDEQSFRATINIDRSPLKKEEEVLLNPFGLFVKEIDMSEHNRKEVSP